MTNIKLARGFVALTITLIILLLVISVSIMTGKVLVGEQRVAANEVRYRGALASAEGQMARAMAAIASGTEQNAVPGSDGSAVDSLMGRS